MTPLARGHVRRLYCRPLIETKLHPEDAQLTRMLNQAYAEPILINMKSSTIRDYLKNQVSYRPTGGRGGWAHP